MQPVRVRDGKADRKRAIEAACRNAKSWLEAGKGTGTAVITENTTDKTIGWFLNFEWREALKGDWRILYFVRRNEKGKAVFRKARD